MQPEDRKEIARLLKKVLQRHDAKQRTVRKKAVAYTAAEIACKVGKTLRQVHEWCREGQLIAKKLDDSRSGPHGEWRILHAELDRYLIEGLYPRYSTTSFAKELLKDEKEISLSSLCSTVETWCIDGLIKAKKCPNGWRISSQELKRYRNDGLLRSS